MNRTRTGILRPLSGHRAGNSLIIVLGIVALAALLTASSIRVAAARYRNSHYSTSWNRAIFAAEGAADVAILAIRQNDWVAAGWTGTPGPPGTPAVSKQVILQSNPIVCGATVNVDTVSLSGKTWYRVRSLGWAELPGAPEPAPDKQDNTLRKLSLHTDRDTGGAVSTPKVSRIVELLVEPVGPKPFARALLGRQVYGIPENTSVDSFDSDDATKSTGGQYDLAKRQYKGHIATLDTAAWELNQAWIFGDALSPNANVSNSSNVQGNVKDLFAFAFPAIAAPAWPLIHQNFGAITNTSVSAEAGPAGAPRRYKFDSINLTAAAGHIHITLPAGQTEGDVEIWVPDAVLIETGGKITVDPGIRATFHFGGDVAIRGDGIINGSQRAERLTILAYGGNAGTHPGFTIQDSDFFGAVYAPWSSVTLATPDRDISGSFIAHSLSLADKVRLHYDEHLGTIRLGDTGDLLIRSWVEAVR